MNTSKSTARLIIVVLWLINLLGCQQADEPTNYVFTVNGKVPSDQLGMALTHEHIMSNFGGERALDPNYDQRQLFSQVVPYLKKVKSLSVNTIFDCTTSYFGRDVELLKALADSSGVQIVTNTGYYAAANDRYVPEFAYSESAEQIAKRWIKEFENGIQGTEIRPGFIKLAFDAGKPSEIDLKLFEAGVIAHRETGLTLVTHSGENVAAVSAQLSILKNYKVDPGAWVWAHAQNVATVDTLIAVAQHGGWVSLDGVRMLQNQGDSLSHIQKHLEFLQVFRAEGLLNKVLLSHDGNSFPRGRAIRPYDAIMLYLMPMMRKTGFTEEEITQLMVKNPAKAFSIERRLLEE